MVALLIYVIIFSSIVIVISIVSIVTTFSWNIYVQLLM